jgi:CHAT domain-containing protein/tetratricopeptide (TPR) repeat protein
MAQGLYARAESLLERALTIQEAAHGKDHPDVASTLTLLAHAYSAQGLYVRAEPLFEHALAIQEATFGKDHPSISITLKLHALLYMDQELYARAEPLFERALAIQEAALGQGHPDVATTLNNLALIHVNQGRLAKAPSFLAQALSASEAYLRNEVHGLSEARLATLLDQLRSDEESLYALVRSNPDNAPLRRLALATTLLRKCRSVEEVANTSFLIYRGLGAQDRETFERLRASRGKLSQLALNGPGTLSAVSHEQQLKALADQADSLELELARRSAPLRALRALPPVSKLVDHVAAALPRDGALVEFVAYSDSTSDPTFDADTSEAPGQLRYLALLLFADGRIEALDLGPAERIDRAALLFHEALADRAVSYQDAAQVLYERAFQPLVPLLGKVRRVFLSPDGQLTLVPFAALHDGHHFLVEDWDITYLTSGKDLLPRPEGIAPAQSVVVLADPDFSASPAAPSPEAEVVLPLTERSFSLNRFFSSLRADLADQPWPPLPGTRREAEAIHGLFPHAQLLLGSSASKDALLRLPTPGILHIATHGFFLEDPDVPAHSRAVGHFGTLGDTGPRQPPANPLLRSGLVLAGAYSPATEHGSRRGESSLVTALELTGLNLWGTQLVVLSACDTGRGDVRHGQGIFGLRRALAVAGAQTLVTSLWKINDEATSELMEAYYRNLLAGQGRTSALREAMRDFRHKQPHPHFWAPFIAIGLDAPLQGVTLR